MRSELLIRVPRPGRWFLLVVTVILALSELLVVQGADVDAEVHDDRG